LIDKLNLTSYYLSTLAMSPALAKVERAKALDPTTVKLEYLRTQEIKENHGMCISQE
jgi:hypothetical protein